MRACQRQTPCQVDYSDVVKMELKAAFDETNNVREVSITVEIHISQKRLKGGIHCMVHWDILVWFGDSGLANTLYPLSSAHLLRLKLVQ